MCRMFRALVSRIRRLVERWWGPEALTDLTDIAEHDANR